jgi:membrane-associated phospholipid phosphatase
MTIRLLLIIILMFRVITPSKAQYSDIGLLRNINKNNSAGLVGTSRFVSTTVTPISIAFPTTLMVLGKISGDRTTLYNGFKSGIAITATVTTYTLLKYIINRERPYNSYPDILKRANESTPSFPSGHTSSAFCTATTLSLMYPKWYVVVPAYSWASMVAYSRMYLGMHYPSDVFAGALLGVGTSLLTFEIYKWIGKKQKLYALYLKKV